MILWCSVEHAEFGSEVITHLVVWETLLRGDQTLVALLGAVALRKKREALLHGPRQFVICAVSSGFLTDF